MKAYIHTHGDRSVGIDGYNTDVELAIDSLETDRERIRSKLQDAFGFIWDEDVRLVHVMFDDELDVEEPSYEDGLTDAEADAMTLASAGMGTDEDYGHFGGDYE